MKPNVVSPRPRRGLLDYFWSSLDDHDEPGGEPPCSARRSDLDLVDDEEPPSSGLQEWIFELERELANLVPHDLTPHDLEVYEAAFLAGDDPADVAQRILARHLSFEEEF